MHAESSLAGTAGAQSGQEPVSGVQGKGTTSEPYDQGNAGGTSHDHARNGQYANDL